MVSVAKCVGIMAGIGAVGGAGTTYFFQSKFDKVTMAQANSLAKDGKIPISGRTRDGKMWDGKVSVGEFKKDLFHKRTILSAFMGLGAAACTAIISGLTLLLRGKAKIK